MCFHTQHWPQHCSKLGITNYLHYFFSPPLLSITPTLSPHSLTLSYTLPYSLPHSLTHYFLSPSLSLTHSLPLSPHTPTHSLPLSPHSLTHSLSPHTLSLAPSLPTLTHCTLRHHQLQSAGTLQQSKSTESLLAGPVIQCPVFSPYDNYPIQKGYTDCSSWGHLFTERKVKDFENTQVVPTKAETSINPEKYCTVHVYECF